MFENQDIASQRVWMMALFTAGIAVCLMFLLSWRIKFWRFRQLKWHVLIASALFWGVFATTMVWSFWDSYYWYFAPDIARWIAPLDALLYGAIGFLLWWLARHLPGNPVANFCLLGGLESIPEHLLGIFRFKIMDIPMLQGISAESVMVFAVFEYIVYWGGVLLLAMILQNGIEWWRRWRQQQVSNQGTAQKVEL